MKKLSVFFGILTLTVLFVLAGCGNAEKKADGGIATALGLEDTALTSQKGEGEATTYVYKGKTCVSQRTYDETVFGLKARVDYFYSDAGAVMQIIAVYDGIDRKTVVEKVTSALGEPSEKQEESDGSNIQFRYRWVRDGATYTILNPPESQVALIIEKEKK